MPNFTDEGVYETLQALSCTSSLHGNHFIHSLAAFNVFLAITASLGNALILAALRKETSLYPPSKLMFQCLTVTDLCVGLLTQPLFIIELMSAHHQRIQLCFTVLSINDVAGLSFSGVSLFTIAAISVDRLIALRLGLRYKRTITLRRTRGMLMLFFIISITTCSLRRFWKHVLFSRVISVLIYSSLAISVLSYLTIYLTLRRHHNAMQQIVQHGQPNGEENSRSIARYRKTVSTALCIQLTMITCYLPYAVVVALVRQSPSLNIVVRLTITLALLNSSLNPILYCWKINGVRQAVKEIINLGVICRVRTANKLSD